VDITKAALAAGHKVVATSRNTDSVAKALVENENLLIVRLDVTKKADANVAVVAAVEKWGGIDVSR
jgi:NADP-dependent 3-hydroxy acid dehydrogenase YdfG